MCSYLDTIVAHHSASKDTGVQSVREYYRHRYCAKCKGILGDR